MKELDNININDLLRELLHYNKETSDAIEKMFKYINKPFPSYCDCLEEDGSVNIETAILNARYTRSIMKEAIYLNHKFYLICNEIKIAIKHSSNRIFDNFIIDIINDEEIFKKQLESATLYTLLKDYAKSVTNVKEIVTVQGIFVDLILPFPDGKDYLTDDLIASEIKILNNKDIMSIMKNIIHLNLRLLLVFTKAKILRDHDSDISDYFIDSVIKMEMGGNATNEY